MGRPTARKAELDGLLCPWQEYTSVSDSGQCYWQLQCNVHVKLCTMDAADKQWKAHGCLRCDRCDRSLHPTQRSRFEKYAWDQLEHTLVQSDVRQFMSHRMPHMHGRDMGYVVEAKVLRGKFGAADIYIPSLDLIIQVDGQHHDNSKQLETDARFDAEAYRQGRALLRLHHEDMLAFHIIILPAVMLCMQRSKNASTALGGLVMYSSTHLQQARPQGSVTIPQ